MPLRRSPLLTPRSLAARRANALKSTGPRTPCGKARVSLNALKHGQACGPAGRAVRFRERLLRAGYRQQEALYGDLRSCLAQAFGARTPQWRRQVDRFAAEAWCMAVGRASFRTKLECALQSVPKDLWVLAQDVCEGGFRPRQRYRPGFARSLRYQAQDNYRRIGVAFWIQRRRYLTEARVRRITKGLERFRLRPADEDLEVRVRCRVFRLRRPGWDERMFYGLDRNGDPDWSRRPWRSLPGYRERWEAARRRHSARADAQPGSRVDADCDTRPWTPASAGATSSGVKAVSRAESGLVHRLREVASRVSSWVRSRSAKPRPLDEKELA